MQPIAIGRHIVFGKRLIAGLIMATTAGAAAAQAPGETGRLTARAKSQLECAAYYRILIEAYPENWQTGRRDRMRDAFVLLRSAGSQNLISTGASKDEADEIIRAQVRALTKLAEGEQHKPQLQVTFRDCQKLHNETLAHD